MQSIRRTAVGLRHALPERPKARGLLSRPLAVLRNELGSVGIVRRFCVAGFVTSLAVLANLGGSPVSARAGTDGLEPYFRVTWNATATGSVDETEAYQDRTVHRVATHRVVMSGTTVVRQDPSSFQQDNLPFTVTVRDDFEETITTTYYDTGCVITNQSSWRINDPTRYSSGPQDFIFIYPPQTGPGGSWTMEDPIVGCCSAFSYIFYSHDTSCGEPPDDDETTLEVAPYATALWRAGELVGDTLGNEFAKITTFTNPLPFDPPLEVHWDVTARRLLGRDLTVEQLEITQGLQDTGNSIPLVQGRRTFVRAYLGIGNEPGPVANVTGRLTASTPGAQRLGPIEPLFPIFAPDSPEWRDLTHTLNFELPTAWTEYPFLLLEVEVNPEGEGNVPENNRANNKAVAGGLFRSCDPLTIQYLQVERLGQSPSPATVVGDEFLRKIFPVADTWPRYSYKPHAVGNLRWDGFFSGSSDPDPLDTGDQLLRVLERLRLSSIPRPMHLFAWLPANSVPYNGYGMLGPGSAFGADTTQPDRWRRTFAHEIGHNYHFDHSEWTTSGAHWFDIYGRDIKYPPGGSGDLKDFMWAGRLEPESWISPLNYVDLVDIRCLSGSPSGGSRVPTTSSPSASHLLVTGRVVNTMPASGELDSLHRVAGPAEFPPGGSEYCIRLRDASADLIASHCFNASFLTDSETERYGTPFSMVIPEPPDLESVELVSLRDGALDSKTRSDFPPVVTVNHPNAVGLVLDGTEEIHWTGSDPDSDPLSYEVAYSPDGGTSWYGLASNLSDESVTADFGRIAGTIAGLIRVSASDGFHSVTDVSDHSFNVPNKAPIAFIRTPVDGSTYGTTESIKLLGGGMDLEQGSIADWGLEWFSDRDGPLGTGELVEVILSEGDHALTLVATDDGGRTDQATVSFSVHDDVPPPDSELVFADGFESGDLSAWSSAAPRRSW